MRPTLPARIESLDILKGMVMVLMTLDHVRDYFHADVSLYNALDPLASNLPTYFARWITHFCAPAFSFLAGASAFLAGQRKTVGEVSTFLFKRGLWLVFVDMFIITFAWFFDVHFSILLLATLWSLGMSMLFLAGMVYVPRWANVVISLLLICGHNAFDGIHLEDNVVWAVLHDGGLINLGPDHRLVIAYPIIPWVGVMALGYAFGAWYKSSVDGAQRRKNLLRMGLGCIALFALLNGFNLYGDPEKWQVLDTTTQTFMSFFNREKYPPSLQYLLMTLGPALLVLAWAESWKGPIVRFFTLFGRVPFFFYILHLYLIHGLALLAAEALGFGWQAMILHKWISGVEELQGYGFNLWVVYGVSIGVVAACYPLCRWFDAYKRTHKEQWWLSYV